MHRRGNLGRDVVIRERADQTDGRLRYARGDDREVGMLGFAGLCQTVETATELDDPTAVAQGIERVGVNTAGDQVASAQCAAFVAESRERGGDVARFHGG